MDLDQFAQTPEATSKKTRCMTCNLPPELLKQVNQARTQENRVSFPIISRWLKAEHDIDITQATIRNHFVAGHHDKS